MDVSHPIRAAIPTLDAVVLESLDFTTAPLSLTQVHRLCGTGSLAGVRRVLLRLCETGLVLAVPGGFVLNRDHLAAPAVHLLADMRAELHKRIRVAVSAWPRQPQLVAVFGSFARRDGDEASDIDLLVVGPRALAALSIQLAQSVQRWTGNNCQVVLRSSQEIHSLKIAGEPIVTHWQDDAVAIVGDLSILRGSSGRSNAKHALRKR